MKTVNCLAINIPDYYQKVDSMPDDPGRLLGAFLFC